MEFAPWPLSESRCFCARFRQRALTSVAAGCEPIPAFPLPPGPSTSPAWPSAASTSAGCEPFSAFPLLPGLPTCPAGPSAAPASARCEPVPAFLLQPGPPTCPAWPSAVSVSAGCEPFSAFSLLPDLSTCPAWLSAASTSARCEPFSPNRLAPASRDSGSWSGTMAAGARKQAASCDAFVLSRRLPAPDAPLKRGISFAKIRGFKVADYNPRLAPVRGTSADAWNIAVRTRGVFTHRDDFQKLACAERGLVRTGTAPIISESAVAWTFLVITPATVGREESHRRAPHSARAVAAGDRAFRRRCRLNGAAC